MKKYVLGLVFGFLILLTACAPLLPAPKAALSDLQITACNAADQAGTCDSRLPEVGIVLKEECCEQLGRCCV